MSCKWETFIPNKSCFCCSNNWILYLLKRNHQGKPTSAWCARIHIIQITKNGTKERSSLRVSSWSAKVLFGAPMCWFNKMQSVDYNIYHIFPPATCTNPQPNSKYLKCKWRMCITHKISFLWCGFAAVPLSLAIKPHINTVDQWELR